MSIDSGIQAQIKNIEAEYGKPIAAWLRLVRESGLQKHTEIVAMLKLQHGLKHGAAHRIGLLSKAAGTPSAGASGAALYGGKKAALLPIHSKLLETIGRFGNDIEIAAKTGYLSLRRGKQFAMLKPAAKHVDVGLILKGKKVTARLESAATFNRLFTHRVRVESLDAIDAQLIAWLQAAYTAAE